MIRLLALGVYALATGCASVTGGNTQKMYVQTESQTGAPVAGADCSLSNDKGTWRIQSPGDTSITRSNKRMEVKCDKSSLPQGIVSVESSTRAAMFGNIIIGGVVGAVIDHSSGAAYEYPEVIKVIMGRMSILDTPKGATPAATAEAIKNANIRPAGGAPPGVTAVRAAAPAPVPQGGPSASGQARIDDVDAVPYLGDKGREDYRQWVGRPTPKAFAVGTDGVWFGAWSLTPANPAHPTDPSERAMQVCQERTKGSCMMYAVNGSVVWVRPPSIQVQQAMHAADPAPVRPVNFGAATSAPAPAIRYAHSRAVPAASGYASALDSQSVPVPGEGKSRYAHYLTLPSPKAFVVYDNGGWRFWFNSPDSMVTLLDTCAREGRRCWLYAVDDRVVWREDVQQRTSRSDQLGK